MLEILSNSFSRLTTASFSRDAGAVSEWNGVAVGAGEVARSWVMDNASSVEQSARGTRNKAGSRAGFAGEVLKGCCWTRSELDEDCGLRFASFLNIVRNSSVNFDMVVNEGAVEHEAVASP